MKTVETNFKSGLQSNSTFSSSLEPSNFNSSPPLMESCEHQFGFLKVGDESSERRMASQEGLWQWSSDGRDFHKLSVDNDSLNLQIQKSMAERNSRNELIIENLEQCTEDHEYDRMNKSISAEDFSVYSYDSEYEETEYKLLQVNGMRSCNADAHVITDHEKEDAEKDVGDEREENEKEKETKETEKFISEYEEKIAEENKKYENEVLETTPEKEPEQPELEKYENEMAEKEEKEGEAKEHLAFSEEGELSNRDTMTGTMYDSRQENFNVKQLLAFQQKLHSNYISGMEERKEKESSAVADEPVIDSGFFDANMSMEDAEGADQIKEKEAAHEGLNFADLEQLEPRSDAMEGNLVELLKPGSLVSAVESLTRELGLADAITDVTTCCHTVSGIKLSSGDMRRNEEKLQCTDEDRHEMMKSEENQEWLKSGGVYSRQDLVKAMAKSQPSAFPYIWCRDIEWLTKQEQKWYNISNFTVVEKDPEFANCKYCPGGNGNVSGKSSQGSSGNDNSGNSQQSGCGSQLGCTSFTGFPSNCGGGCGDGGDDNDKWRKESFCPFSNTDERKTKQDKELKKKSPLEKANLTGHDSNSSVSYGCKESLKDMALKWEERAENLRNNTSMSVQCTEGVILDSYRKKFCITEDGHYRLNEEWVVAIAKSDPLGCRQNSSTTPGISGLRGSGIAGKCYPCCDFNTSTIFCVKEIELIKYSASEITILLELDHPRIVKLYGAIFSDEKVFIMMELIDGPTLQEYIQSQLKLNYRTALFITKQLLEVLSYLHSEGVIHDDMKADNIMLQCDGTAIVLIDFGLAKKLSAVEEGKPPCGSQCGMSPEKAASEGYDTRADVWAATVVLVHMISGYVPWSIKEQSPPLEDVPEDVPLQILSLIENGWTVNAQNRPFAHQLLSHEAFQLLDVVEDEVVPPSNEISEEFMNIDDLEKFIKESEQLLDECEETFLKQCNNPSDPGETSSACYDSALDNKPEENNLTNT